MRTFALVALLLAPLSTDPNFADVTKQAGVKGGGRAAWSDVNNDGFPDLILGNRLFLNKRGSFVDVTDKCGLKGNPGQSALIADFNNDGKNDIYFTGGEGALFLGSGRGTFRRGRAEANPYKKSQAAAAADIDGDGYLDIYLCNFEEWKDNTFPFPDVILKNHRGTLKVNWTSDKERTWPARGASFCDFDRDGDMDVYVSNYRLVQNSLYVNEKGKLTDEAEERGCAGSVNKRGPIKDGHGRTYYCSGHTIGSTWADFDNDGSFDLLVGNFSHADPHQDRPQFLKNNKGRFEDVSRKVALSWQESYANPAAGDFDNDGDIDFYFTTVYPNDGSRLFRNEGDWRFSDVTSAAGVATSKTYQAAWADIDNDGDLDLMAGGKLFKNTTRGGSWVKVALTGSHCNRSAVGAQVTIRLKDRVLVRQVECGTGNGAQNDLTLHFGLGKHSGEVEAEIVWPCGKKQTEKTRGKKTLKVKEKR